MFPKGFVANGMHCGVAKKKDKKDLALFYSTAPAVGAGMFTANLVQAAPVIVSREHLKKTGGKIRAIVANSGCANACTGAQGNRDARLMCRCAGDSLNIDENEVLAASTGVIGKFLPVRKIAAGIKALAKSTGSDRVSFRNAAEAIMTTDTFVKTASVSIMIGSEQVTVWGCAKGSGMIHPDLRGLHATMFAFLLTDAAISGRLLDRALNEAVRKSFNCVSVDGDTSTNDTVVAAANGAAENRMINVRNKDYEQFSNALDSVCLQLAKMMARDGEGATCLVEIEIKNAQNEAAAKKIAATIATSPLVKTAIFGRDANWGRIIAAAGRAGVSIHPNTIDIYLGDMQVARRGMAVPFSEARGKKLLSQKEVKITVDLRQGRARAAYYTCDLSFDYIKINASYRS